MATTEVKTEGTPGVGDDRRSVILRAALEIIDERGFADTRIADVAERAGVSPALVIYYFQTKDKLLSNAMRMAEEAWYRLGAIRLEGLTSARARLEEVVAMTCLPETEELLPEAWTVWLDLWAQALRHEAVAAVRAEADAHWRSTIAGIVADGQAAGEFSRLDANEFAVALSALLDGLAIQIALGDPEVGPERAFQITMYFAGSMLGFDGLTHRLSA